MSGKKQVKKPIGEGGSGPLRNDSDGNSNIVSRIRYKVLIALRKSEQFNCVLHFKLLSWIQ